MGRRCHRVGNGRVANFQPLGMSRPLPAPWRCLVRFRTFGVDQVAPFGLFTSNGPAPSARGRGEGWGRRRLCPVADTRR
jgi:hypothetical protein